MLEGEIDHPQRRTRHPDTPSILKKSVHFAAPDFVSSP
ncbi:FIG01202395: hypothetical protein [Vibrio cholerae]|nr:FIG01202395: hypothetical protein [Vibrio cholerae]